MKKIVAPPPIDRSFDDLTNTTCRLNDYQFGIDVYISFNCKNLYANTILYIDTDPLLLVEIMIL